MGAAVVRAAERTQVRRWESFNAGADVMAVEVEARGEAVPGGGPRRSSAVWGGPFVLGLLMAVLGVAALGAAFLTSLVTVLFYGAMLVGMGIAEVAAAFRVRRTGGPFGLYLLGGVLSVVVGLFALLFPAAGLGALTLLLAGYFFASGLFHAITSVMDRYERWGWDFLYGAISVFLGVVVMARWPVSAAWLVGTLVGIGILSRGLALMAGSLVVRRTLRQVTA